MAVPPATAKREIRNPLSNSEKRALEGKGLPKSLHSIPKSPRKSSPATAAFGSSLRLVSHERLYSQFAPFGISFEAFQALLLSLRIPSIHIGDTRLVDMTTFYIVMHAILRPGEPDYIAPCAPLPPSSLPSRTTVDPLWLTTAWPAAVSSLVDSRALLEPQLTPRAILDLAHDAAARLSSFPSSLPLCEVTTSYPDGTFDARWLPPVPSLSNPRPS